MLPDLLYAHEIGESEMVIRLIYPYLQSYMHYNITLHTVFEPISWDSQLNSCDEIYIMRANTKMGVAQ